jgi:hypothetical protein
MGPIERAVATRPPETGRQGGRDDVGDWVVDRSEGVARPRWHLVSESEGLDRSFLTASGRIFDPADPHIDFAYTARPPRPARRACSTCASSLPPSEVPRLIV